MRGQPEKKNPFSSVNYESSSSNPSSNPNPSPGSNSGGGSGIKFAPEIGLLLVIAAAIFGVHQRKANHNSVQAPVQAPPQMVRSLPPPGAIAQRQLASVDQALPRDVEVNRTAEIKSRSLNELKKLDFVQQNAVPQAPSFQILETTLTPWTEVGADDEEPSITRPKSGAGRSHGPHLSASEAQAGTNPAAAVRRDDQCIGVTASANPPMNPENILHQFGHFSSSRAEAQYAQEVSTDSRFVRTLDFNADCPLANGKTLSLRVDGQSIGQMTLSSSPQMAAFALTKLRVVKGDPVIPFRVKRLRDGNYTLDIYSPTGTEPMGKILQLGEHITKQ